MKHGPVKTRFGAVFWVCFALGFLVGSTICAAEFSCANIDFLGRGGTYGLVARTGDIDNVAWNASGLGFGDARAGYAGFMDYLVGFKGGVAGYTGIVMSSKVGYGVYAAYLSSGAVIRTGWDDPTGGRGDDFSHGEVVFGVSAGRRLAPYISAGIGVKLARESTDDVTAGGIIGDVSGTARFYPFGSEAGAARYEAYSSLVLRNVELVRWEDRGGDVPTAGEFGLVIEAPGDAWAGGVSFCFGREGRREIRTGLAAWPSDEFEIRFGYRRRTGAMSDSANDMPWERGLTGGFGVGFGRVWLDYTYEDASPLDNVHKFGLRVAARPGHSN